MTVFIEGEKLSSELKAALRKELRARRRALPEAETKAAAAALTERFLSLDEYKSAELILSYMPAKNEIDVTAINHAALLEGKRVALPLCIENGGLRLLVPRGEESLHPGAYGILEPDPELSDEVAPSDIDLIIVPAVAFTSDGRRLGQGGGYYDRLLASTHAKTVGVGYDFQLLEDLPSEPHDRRLDRVLTPSGGYACADENPNGAE